MAQGFQINNRNTEVGKEREEGREYLSGRERARYHSFLRVNRRLQHREGEGFVVWD